MPDRIYLNCYVPKLQTSAQVVAFLSDHLGYPFPSPALFRKLGERFRKAVADFAAEHHIPVVRLARTTLRELQLLDTDCERLVFRIRAHNDGAILAATDDDLDELIGSVAAEANHESNRRRQQRLDAAFDALNAAAQAPDGW